MPPKRKKPGPPKTTGNAPARAIRVHDDEWTRWKAKAQKQGLSLSELIREAVRKY